MKKKPANPVAKREVLQFARHLERSINRLGRQPAKRPTDTRRIDNTPPDAA